MRLIQTVRPALEMSRELLDCVQIGRDRRGSEIAALEFLQHHLPTMGHKTPPVTPTLPGRSREAYAQRPPRQRLGPDAAVATFGPGAVVLHWATSQDDPRVPFPWGSSAVAEYWREHDNHQRRPYSV